MKPKKTAKCAHCGAVKNVLNLYVSEGYVGKVCRNDVSWKESAK